MNTQFNRELKNKRINVRANFNMTFKLEILKNYLSQAHNKKYSYSDTLEYIINYAYLNKLDDLVDMINMEDIPF